MGHMIAEADLDTILTALADPTRRAIIARLTKGEASVLELAEWIGSFREFYEESFDRLDEYLEDLKKEKKADAKQARAHRRTR